MSDDLHNTLSILAYLLAGMAVIVLLAYWVLKKLGPPK